MKISVITPSYNSAAFIERAIQSVAMQNYSDWEHWIIDGGSKDGTVEILKKYPHVKWVSEKDNGQSDAMNKGFERSSGDIVVYLNADDYFFEGAFSAVVNEFKRGASFVVGDVLIKSRRLGSEFVNTPRYTHEGMLRHWEPNAFCHNPVGYFYLREVQKTCPFNVNNYATMDLEFLLDASVKYRFTKIDYVLGCFDDGTDTKTAVTQAKFDYWRNGNFPYIDRHLKALPHEKQVEFCMHRRNGYAQCQKESNARIQRPPRIDALKDLKISVVIPCFNGTNTLKKAIDSVISQKIAHLEIIVVDDFSDDKPEQFVQQNYGSDVRIRVVRHGINRKLGAARNTGIFESSGDFIFFLDCDDWLDSGALYRMLQVTRETDADVVQCGTRMVFADNAHKTYHAEAFSTDNNREALEYLCDYKIGSIAWNKLYRSEFLKKNTIEFVEGYWHEDVVFAMKVAFFAEKIVSIDEIFVNYYQGPVSITRSRPGLLHMKSYIRLWRDIEKFVGNSKIHEMDETGLLSERLLLNHGLNDIYPKMVRYAEANGVRDFSRDLRAATQVEVNPKEGYIYASVISSMVEKSLRKDEQPKFQLSRVKHKFKSHLQGTLLFLPARSLYSILRKLRNGVIRK